jgi:hypothetical protein
LFFATLHVYILLYVSCLCVSFAIVQTKKRAKRLWPLPGRTSSTNASSLHFLQRSVVLPDTYDITRTVHTLLSNPQLKHHLPQSLIPCQTSYPFPNKSNHPPTNPPSANHHPSLRPTPNQLRAQCQKKLPLPMTPRHRSTRPPQPPIPNNPPMTPPALHAAPP